MIVKVYGERNTGTNYLMQLLSKHLDVMEVVGSALKLTSSAPNIDLQKLGEIGWKHRLVNAEFLQSQNVHRDAILIITLTKNPYSWLLSLHKRPYAPIHLRNRVIVRKPDGSFRQHTDFNIRVIRRISRWGRWGRWFLAHFPQWSEYEPLEFRDFIRAKWFTQYDEGHDAAFKNPIKLWNVKNEAYLALARHYNVLSFTYEELLASPEKMVNSVLHHLGLPEKTIENIEHAAKKEDQSSKSYADYKKYYLSEDWRQHLSQQDVRWISSQLDPAVMKAFSYPLLDPKSFSA